jgi:hypothetical protein
MPTRSPESAALAAAQSPFFCSTPDCPFHVHVEDQNVRGFGDWATLEDGTTVSHRWLDGRLLCDLCAQAMQSQSAAAPMATECTPALRTADSRR